jgi:hypothetical protein
MVSCFALTAAKSARCCAMTSRASPTIDPVVTLRTSQCSAVLPPLSRALTTIRSLRNNTRNIATSPRIVRAASISGVPPRASSVALTSAACFFKCRRTPAASFHSISRDSSSLLLVEPPRGESLGATIDDDDDDDDEANVAAYKTHFLKNKNENQFKKHSARSF